MVINKLNLLRTLSVFTLGLLSNAALATPTVSGNVISWTEEGWHQVQLQPSYESVCNGGRQCTVAAGVYTVINHGSGERFPNIVVPGTKPDESTQAPLPVAASGQKTNYAFGDDGDFQLGVTVTGERFSDNNDGTFVDKLTGITWLGIRDCIIERNWFVALEYSNNLYANSVECPNLNDGSLAGDWRLPSIKELYSLVDVSDNSPVWAKGIPFSGTWANPPWENYWSSTSFSPVPDNNAYVMDAGFGLISSWAKSSREFYAWPIRVEQ